MKYRVSYTEKHELIVEADNEKEAEQYVWELFNLMTTPPSTEKTTITVKAKATKEETHD